MKHLDESVLMMLHFDPDGSTPARQHVDSCEACRASFEVVSKTLAEDAKRGDDFVDELPESFWERQRTSILRRAVAENQRRGTQKVLWRGFVAAMLVAIVALVLSRNFRETPSPSSSPLPTAAKSAPPAQPEPAGTARVAVLDEVQSASDPWASDELQSFHEVVQWETWEQTPAPAHKGGTS